MKEQFMPTQLSREGLTNQPNSSSLEVRGNIFMAEPGQGEILQSQSSEAQKVQRGTPTEPILTRDVSSIESPALREFATNFQERANAKPLSEWSTGDLEHEYLSLHSLTARLSSKEGFAEGEKISADASPLSRTIMEELSRRGVDLRELFLESVKRTKEAGTPVRSIGAATLLLTDYLDSRLNPIVQELNAEVGRVGAGNPLDPVYIQEQRARVRDLLDRGMVDAAQAARLIGELNSWMGEAVEAEQEEQGRTGLTREEQEREYYNGLTKEELIEVIEHAPSVEASHFPEVLLAAAMRFKETREMLINRIIFKSFEDETETNPYEINLYAQSNLDTLLGYLSRKERARYDYYISLKTAAQLFHAMNATIIRGNLDEFIRIAEGINYQHFELIKKISGVSEVMRLYEQKYQDYLARYGRITTAGYVELKKEVEGTFMSMNNAGLIRSELESEREGPESWKMEDWEIRRALNVGRTFFNLTFRAAEQIASGKISRRRIEGKNGEVLQEESEHEQQYSSYPQESAVRIMNWVQYMLQRFEIAAPRGGVEFLNMVKKNYFEFLGAHGRKLGKNTISELGGMNVRELELGGMFGVSGVYSSWRIENMAFPKIEVTINGHGINIRQWIRDNKKYIDAARNKSKGGTQDKLLGVLSPLIDNMDIALGVLLKQEAVSGELGYKARQRIWERVAELNLPLMIDYLSRIRRGGDLSLPSKDEIADLRDQDKLNGGMDWDAHDTLPDGRTADQTRWEVLKEKILLHHEWSIKKAAGVDLNRASEPTFTADEIRLKNLIIEKAKKLAPELADIAFPYLPFMNDVPFELLDYGRPGEEFYKRRSGGDLPSFNKAEGSFVALMNNPGGLGWEEALKQFDAIVKGIESPQGTPDAQERVFPMLEAFVDFQATTPGYRQSLHKMIREMARRPTSLAQKYAGMEAESIDEFQTRKMLDTALKIGIVNTSLYNELKKKKGLTLTGMFWAILRDFFWVPIASGVWEFGKATAKEKP